MGDRLLRACCDVLNRVHEISARERGATAVEYSIMLVLVAVVIIAVVQGLGRRTRGGIGRAGIGW